MQIPRVEDMVTDTLLTIKKSPGLSLFASPHLPEISGSNVIYSYITKIIP